MKINLIAKMVLVSEFWYLKHRSSFIYSSTTHKALNLMISAMALSEQEKSIELIPPLILLTY